MTHREAFAWLLLAIPYLLMAITFTAAMALLVWIEERKA